MSLTINLKVNNNITLNLKNNFQYQIFFWKKSIINWKNTLWKTKNLWMRFKK